MLVKFNRLRRPLSFIDADPVRDHLASVLKGWRFEACGGDASDPVISVQGEGEHYRLDAPWLEGPLDEPSSVSAVCSVIVDLVHAFMDEHPDLLCLHCGAVEVGGGLVVFPSTNRAGKSTLMTRFAASGHRVFADDLLIVTPDGEGMALGAAPRLRLPLPDCATPSFRRYVDQQAGPDDGYYRYVLPSGDAWPAHGETAPIRAVVLLDRQGEGEASLVGARRSDGLARLISQNVARSAAAAAILDRLHMLIGDLPCLKLRYSELEEPVRLIEEAFGAEAFEPDRGGEAVPVSLDGHVTASGEVSGEQPSDDEAFQRHPEVHLKRLQDELFLVDPLGEGIFRLDITGSGLWTLMEQPLSLREAVDAFTIAFPDMERAVLERDLRVVLSELRRAGLIWPAG